jgi:PKD repeat protein
MRSCQFLIFLCIYSLLVNGQHQADNWYFGKKAGITFSLGVAGAVSNGSLISMEGCTSISDVAGNLLFYTSGDTIWNWNHQVMLNGAGIAGNSSSTQSAIIIRRPGSASEYFLFTNDQMAGPNGLQYSAVDMSLASGNGSVTTKNSFLYGPCTEKLAAVRHCNGVDYWVLSHEWNSNKFRCYLLTAAGVNTVPVISQVGTSHAGFLGGTLGQMKFSPSGKKIGLVISELKTVEIFDFNSSSGIVSNPIILSNTLSAVYGCEFSPDNSKFYAACYQAPNPIYQWDLCAATSSLIPSTQTAISGSLTCGSLQLTPTGEILVSKFIFKNFLGSIRNPNASGLASNYKDTAIMLLSGTSALGLPSFPADFLKSPLQFSHTADFSSVCYSLNFTAPADPSISTCTTVNDPISSFQWNFNDPLSGSNTSSLQTPSHVFSGPGSYQVKLIMGGLCVSDTIRKNIIVPALPAVSLSGSLSSCPGHKTILQAGGYSQFVWSTGATGNTIAINPTVTSVYTVTGSDPGNACVSTRIFTFSILPCTGIEESDLDKNCLRIFPNPAGNKLMVTTCLATVSGIIKIYDTSGKKVMELTTQNNQEIELSLSPAVYYLILVLEGKLSTRKLVIQ